MSFVICKIRKSPEKLTLCEVEFGKGGPQQVDKVIISLNLASSDLVDFFS